MRIRHKPPTFVSMWMLDVFCCALGCVTLLWLLNTREAAEQTVRAGAALENWRKTETELSSARQELEATKAESLEKIQRLDREIKELQGKMLALVKDRDETAQKLAKTQQELDGVHALQAKLRDESKTALDAKKKENETLTEQLRLATTRADDSAKSLLTKEREREELNAKLKTDELRLTEMDRRLAAAQEASKSASETIESLRSKAGDLATSKATIRDLEKRLDDARVHLIDLQGKNAKLADKYTKLQSDTDSRFAGVALTGKRVIFLVDISGSMKLTDDKTPAPTKWPTVIETVGKVMRSLPNLEKFQVVIFSQKAEYLLGDEWIEHKGEESIRRVTDALSKVDPSGDTNLYDAFDRAFRFRPSGLDTIYLFSDGLPTSGNGLTPEEVKTLREPHRSAKLARHLRKTLLEEWNRPELGNRVRINSIGFFFESADIGAFLWAMSRENDGSFVGMR